MPSYNGLRMMKATVVSLAVGALLAIVPFATVVHAVRHTVSAPPNFPVRGHRRPRAVDRIAHARDDPDRGHDPLGQVVQDLRLRLRQERPRDLALHLQGPRAARRCGALPERQGRGGLHPRLAGRLGPQGRDDGRPDLERLQRLRQPRDRRTASATPRSPSASATRRPRSTRQAASSTATRSSHRRSRPASNSRGSPPSSLRAMPSAWPALPYESWSATCDTLHAHAQVLGKLSSKLGPPEPQFQHGALRLTARGWETRPLPAPDGSGIFGVALDLHAHEAIVEHGDGRIRRVPLTPNRSVAEVTGARSRRGDRARRGRQAEPEAAGDGLGHPARRGRGARDLQHGAGRGLPGRSRPGDDGPRRAPRAIPGPCDAGQCLVGLLRLRRQPVLRARRGAAVGRLHRAQRHGFAGDRGRLVARRRPLPASGVLRLRLPVARRAVGRRALARRPRAGTRRSASSSSTGTT